MSKQFWQEALAWAVANGTTIQNSTTETILFPDIVIPANYLADGRVLRLTAQGKLSNIVTSPGNITFAIRLGGVSGVLLAKTTAIALNTAAQTDIMWRIIAEMIVRSNGSSGTILCMGSADLAFKNVIQPELMGSAGGASGNTPTTATVDFTQNQNLSLTAQFSVANSGNTITGMNEILESLN